MSAEKRTETLKYVPHNCVINHTVAVANIRQESRSESLIFYFNSCDPGSFLQANTLYRKEKENKSLFGLRAANRLFDMFDFESLEKLDKGKHFKKTVNIATPSPPNHCRSAYYCLQNLR